MASSVSAIDANDWAGVEMLIHKMDGASSNLDSMLKGLVLGVETWKRR